MLHVFGVQYFVSGKGVQSTRCGDNDVGALVLVAEEFGVLCYRCAAVESADTNIGHVLGEASIFVFDLEGEFTSVAEDEDRDFSVDRFELLKRGQDEDGSFPMSRFRLAEYIHTEHRLRDTFLLH